LSQTVYAAFVPKQLWCSSIYCFSSSDCRDFIRNIRSTTIVTKLASLATAAWLWLYAEMLGATILTRCQYV